ncbi:MAG: hypothetical protein Q3999_06480 [Buchananella hordeovulneris]|nr:hypothetical protein [Buchananella hordeovulneris]
MDAQDDQPDVRADKALELLAQLADLVENARTMPMTTSVLISRPHLVALVEDLADAIPADLLEADDVLSGADSVLARAQNEADTERELARHAADGALAEAQAQADEIVNAAQVQAEDIVAAAHAEAEDVLARARQRAEQMVSQDAVVLAAQERVQELEAQSAARVEEWENQAAAKADALMGGANEYADSVLAGLLETAAAIRGEAEAGREEIARRMARARGEVAFSAVTPERKVGAAWQVTVEED